ncbi:MULTISPECIES: ATP-binding cassette domain-containing protein [unclassified Listeria]|uniref:ATP-binding cassette domain-containing protein n=1 Tax=unclassified Listeria TaxID=2642072 RepID=UPI000B58A1AB|nr:MULTISPECIES: ATP-binding cassette domain-containing protein [unclassified Listeria]
MIKLENISKKIDGKFILQDVSLQISPGEFVAILGQSGSGKTTLLHIMGLLEEVQSGSVTINNSKTPSQKMIRELKRNTLGYIFQNYLLLENETVQANLNISRKTKKEEMLSFLQDVGLDSTYISKYVYQLSGGEKQRVAIARVLLKPFDILLADEPTGNLDQKNRDMIINLLLKIKSEGKTVICVTHDYEVAEKADRIITIQEGEVEDENIQHHTR